MNIEIEITKIEALDKSIPEAYCNELKEEENRDDHK